MGIQISNPNVKTIAPAQPLQIDLVLDKVFANLGIRDLLICRQVCRKWEEISTPELNQIINGAKSLDFYEAFHPINKLYQLKCFKRDEDEKRQFRNQNLGNYFHYLEKLPRIIPSAITINFTFHDIHIQSNYLQKFLWKYGHTLQHLTLTWDVYSEEPEHFPNFFKNFIFKQCRNLKRLELKKFPKIYTKKSFLGDDYYQPTNITELIIQHGELEPIEVYNFAGNVFNSCPKLQRLDWSEFAGCDREMLISLLEKSECFEKLKNVRMDRIFYRGVCIDQQNSTWRLRVGRSFSLDEMGEFGNSIRRLQLLALEEMSKLDTED